MNWQIQRFHDKKSFAQICNSYTMASPPVPGYNPRALASGLSYVRWTNMV